MFRIKAQRSLTNVCGDEVPSFPSALGTDDSLWENVPCTLKIYHFLESATMGKIKSRSILFVKII